MRVFTKALLLLLAGACILLARKADANQDAAGTTSTPAEPAILR